MARVVDPVLQETDQPGLVDRLPVISSIKRRGVLLALVILPNGSRSLIPAAWTDWRNADASPGEDDMDRTSSLGKLGDLLQLGKIIDALLSRHAESAPHVESSHAAEPGVSRPCATAIGPSTDAVSYTHLTLPTN